MTQTTFKTKTPTQCTCASCPQFNNFNESRGRSWCKLFDKVAYSHHPLTQDCKLYLPSNNKLEEDTIDTLAQQLKETRVLLDKAKHRRSRKNQLILKAPF